MCFKMLSALKEVAPIVQREAIEAIIPDNTEQKAIVTFIAKVNAAVPLLESQYLLKNGQLFLFE